MVKNAMKRKEAVNDPVLTRILHARQFALKMIANVTYGYTSAGFSGRMPCAEIADAIVHTARRTLLASMRTIEARKEWGARVVYGDTDSMFVLLEGRSTSEAFRIGNEIADTISDLNPNPMKLKMEKVYDGSLMLSKKRYAGHMLESPSQKSPVMDCKGVEVVRRDQCPIVVKLMERVLEILFTTKVSDMSIIAPVLVGEGVLNAVLLSFH